MRSFVLLIKTGLRAKNCRFGVFYEWGLRYANECDWEKYGVHSLSEPDIAVIIPHTELNTSERTNDLFLDRDTYTSIYFRHGDTNS